MAADRIKPATSITAFQNHGSYDLHWSKAGSRSIVTSSSFGTVFALCRREQCTCTEVHKGGLWHHTKIYLNLCYQSIKRSPAIAGKYFVIQNVHLSSQLPCIKRSPVFKGHFTLPFGCLKLVWVFTHTCINTMTSYKWITLTILPSSVFTFNVLLSSLEGEVTIIFGILASMLRVLFTDLWRFFRDLNDRKDLLGTPESMPLVSSSSSSLECRSLPRNCFKRSSPRSFDVRRVNVLSSSSVNGRWDGSGTDATGADAVVLLLYRLSLEAAMLFMESTETERLLPNFLTPRPLLMTEGVWETWEPTPWWTVECQVETETPEIPIYQYYTDETKCNT